MAKKTEKPSATPNPDAKPGLFQKGGPGGPGRPPSPKAEDIKLHLDVLRAYKRAGGERWLSNLMAKYPPQGSQVFLKLLDYQLHTLGQETGQDMAFQTPVIPLYSGPDADVKNEKLERYRAQAENQNPKQNVNVNSLTNDDEAAARWIPSIVDVA